jgi:hypothetical protein
LSYFILSILCVIFLHNSILLSFDKSLNFKIKANQNIGLNQRLVLEQNVTPSNKVSRVDRAQPGFENTQNILITYPIEISAFSTAESVAAGQKIPIFWNKNIRFFLH